MNNLLPKDYELPKKDSDYMKFQEGENKFLILDSAIVGYEYWNIDGKPVRSENKVNTIPSDIKRDKDGNSDQVKHFWAFPVWNFNDERVQILQINQSTIQEAMQANIKNEDWGNPVQTYTTTVTRSGEKLETKYSTQANPPKSIDSVILKAWEEVKKSGFDITKMYEGGHPFEASNVINPDDYPM